MPQIQSLNLGSRPGRSPQKLQTGLDAGEIVKAPDIDEPSHGFPAAMFHQPGKNGFQGDAVQRIFLFVVNHCLISLYRVTG